MGNYDNSHPTHYVRNFFICLWAIIVSLAFAGLFIGIAILNLTLIIACSVICVLALYSLFHVAIDTIKRS